ncbi:MAG: hypothetical protein P4L40_07645 [Terracidiphilus sp.]|nr:hypothetical protein [Terracidiphilus sp.]
MCVCRVCVCVCARARLCVRVCAGVRARAKLMSYFCSPPSPPRRVTARGEIPSPLSVERLAANAAGTNIDNTYPFYIGQPPYSVLNEPPAPVILSDFRVYPTEQLEQGAVVARIGATRGNFSTAKLAPLLARRPDQAADRLVDALALLSAAVGTSLKASFPAQQLFGLLVPLVFPYATPTGCVQPVPVEVRVAASRILRLSLSPAALPVADAAVNAALRLPSLFDAVISELQSSVGVWGVPALAYLGQKGGGVVPPARPAAQHSVGLTAETLALARLLTAQVCVCVCVCVCVVCAVRVGLLLLLWLRS